jgi:hypothetical protein
VKSHSGEEGHEEGTGAATLQPGCWCPRGLLLAWRAHIPDCLSRRPPIGSRDRFARSPCIDFNALAWRSAFSCGATLSKCWHRHGHHHRRHNQRHHDHRHEAPHKQHPFYSGAEEERCSQTPAPVNQRGQLTRPVKGGVIPNWTIFVCIVVRQWSWGIGTGQCDRPKTTP